MGESPWSCRQSQAVRFDDIGPHVAQGHSHEGASERAAQIQNSNSFQRASHTLLPNVSGLMELTIAHGSFRESGQKCMGGT